MSVYSHKTWKAIDEIGRRLDSHLKSSGLQLTMGAEPTYLRPGAAQEQPEWSRAAIGDEKWQFAQELAQRLQKRFFPQGLTQLGQGKLYPGETTARWALRCFDVAAPRGSRRATPAQLLRGICQRLRVPYAHTVSWPGGRALVLGWSDSQGWRSAPWSSRKLELIPVEGPSGLRLPWSELTQGHPAAEIGTALCVSREGKDLRVFLPPLPNAAVWVELVQHCLQTEVCLAFEGYGPPPPQPGQSAMPLRQLSVTPDPGVIEVNLHPASTWEELVDAVVGVDEECREVGLVSHRLGRDGLISGSGGGCHVVVGGPTPEQSPFARRPDFLRSILTCWNHHPCLSYLFSGLFIGPTSQAPRVDEARHDSLYELELAFRELDALGSQSTLVGSILRDLLVDVAGNGHRSEICVDKLFDPLKPGGEQGLLEFRALEMPPNAQMNLVQMLLIRALLWRLWNFPERSPLRHFGNALHDRYMLPTFLWQDLLELLEDLRRHGLPIPSEWFQPHLEFRCPVLGRCSHRGLSLQLRQALEPWPVLGESASSQGTSRPVDSSTQRIEVRVSGWQAGRWALACNGLILPLQALGEGEAVLGVRFRAWQFGQSLHPTLGVQSPLQFDLLELPSRRLAASCRYHTQHPEQGPWDSAPIDLEQARQRREIRFEKAPRQPQAFAYRLAHPQSDYPLTLDLRWQALHDGPLSWNFPGARVESRHEDLDPAPEPHSQALAPPHGRGASA